MVASRRALTTHAHRPQLPHEKVERVFTQEERRLTQNLTLHYKRVLYIVAPSPEARAAAGRQVLVRETNDGAVTIEHKGVALPARAFPKDSRVDQAAIVDNKALSVALATVQQRQREGDAEVFAKRKLTLREEDLLRRSMGEEGLQTRRGPGRPTIRERALARMAQADGASSPGVVDQNIAQAVSRLA